MPRYEVTTAETALTTYIFFEADGPDAAKQRVQAVLRGEAVLPAWRDDGFAGDAEVINVKEATA